MTATKYKPRGRMRMREARWIIRYQTTWGVGLDPEEEYEWQSARFRLFGIESLGDDAPDIEVQGGIEPPPHISAWERELLAPLVREFLTKKGTSR